MDWEVRVAEEGMARKTRKTNAKPGTRKTSRRRRVASGESSRGVTEYRHDEATRKNNPEIGLATFNRVAEPKVRYSYDPHLDPQLVWAGKTEHTSFEVDTVSLHIHERISTHAILRAVERGEKQLDLFADPKLPLTERIEFYQHDVDWANRLILGDSLFVMNSMLKRELMGGKVQMIYVDPPYGIAYGSNFQPRTDRRDVKDGQDDYLTREPEMIKAYRDTWQLGLHSYLTYLRDRLLLCRDLLSQTGSIFVQINDTNLHHVKEVMDEVFGAENYCATITFQKTGGQTSRLLPGTADYLLWYGKDISQVKYRPLFKEKVSGEGVGEDYDHAELPDGTRRRLLPEEREDLGRLPRGSRLFQPTSLTSQGFRQFTSVPFEYEGKTYDPGSLQNWKTTIDGLGRLAAARRIFPSRNTLRYVRYLDDFPASPITTVWTDTGGSLGGDKLYAVQTNVKVIARCILMTTDPGDLVFDPTCGSGTTAYAAEQWGRRWITCDTSRVALVLARQRLLTATFPYYRLARPDQGVSGGFVYKTVPHVTLKSIAQEEQPQEETLYDQPEVDRIRVRVSGPFTVEAIPVPVAEQPQPAVTVGEELAVQETGLVSDLAGSYVDTMVDLLKRSGVTFPGGKRMALGNLRPVASGGILHAEAESREGAKTLRVAVSFGPQHGPVTVLQVEEAVRQAAWGYDTLIFAGFAFDPEAQAFIEKSPHPKLRTHLAHISPDVLVGDLLKASKAHQLFTVFGQPDIIAVPQKDGRWTVELRGVDIYDPTTGELSSSSGEEVAAWFLDQDYDGRTFFICQAFFPGGTNPWEKLQRALRGIMDEVVFETMRGITSHPFRAGEHRRVAVKVVDFRGNEVMRVIDLNGAGRRR